FNKDEIYEIYLNAQSGSSGRHIVAGVDLKNDSLIPVAYEGSSYMHSFEDRLFLIQVPEGGTSADAVCVSPVLENGALVPNTTASQEMVFAALNNWKLNQ
ncbi:MAG: hypothetical protein LBS36_08055, partial [Oscillospiraceae bacterium]|nr:hypothetical protein [Oscillospiraceae bacterium]